MTAVQPGGATSKQQVLREQLETLIQGMAPGDLLPAERRLAQELEDGMLWREAHRLRLRESPRAESGGRCRRRSGSGRRGRSTGLRDVAVVVELLGGGA